MKKFVLKNSETRFQKAETRFQNAETALSRTQNLSRENFKRMCQKMFQRIESCVK